MLTYADVCWRMLAYAGVCCTDLMAARSREAGSGASEYADVC
jgi:hypothetical protein